MSQLFSIMTCLAMLWHSIGGCCWHHDHQNCDGEGSLDEITVQEIAPEHCSHHHEHHDHSTSHSKDSEDPNPCDHSNHCGAADCVFVKSCTPDLSILLDSQGLFLLKTPDKFCLVTTTAILSPNRDMLRHPDDCSSQQHCALYQSWLL